MRTYILLLLLSGGIVLIAVILYFVGSAKTLRIPSVILGTLGGMGLGALLGMAILTFYEQETSDLLGPNDAFVTHAAPAGGGSGPGNSGPPPGGPPMAGMGGGMAGMGGGMGGMGGGRGPNPKTQLVALVTKLDQLTSKPLEVTLDDTQKAKVEEQLKGLDSLKDLSADEAKKRLDALLAVVESQRETMEAAGYRWPGAGGPGGPGMGPGGPQTKGGRGPGGPGGPGGGPGGPGGARGGPGVPTAPPGQEPNPFTVEANEVHLKALSDRLSHAPATANP